MVKRKKIPTEHRQQNMENRDTLRHGKDKREIEKDGLK